MSFTDIDGVFHPTPCPTKAELLRKEIAQRNNKLTLDDINQRLAQAVFPEHRTRKKRETDSSGLFDGEYIKSYVKAKYREETLEMVRIRYNEAARKRYMKRKEAKKNASNNAESE